MTMHESGQMQKIYQKWTFQRQNCLSDDKRHPLGYEKLIATIILVSFGVIIAIIMVSYERISFSRMIARQGGKNVKKAQSIKGIRNCLEKKRKIDNELISLLKTYQDMSDNEKNFIDE